MAALFFVGCLFGGCQWIPANGISRDRAIELAKQAGFGLENPTVTGAREGRLRDLRNNQQGEPGPGLDLNELVWQVTVQGRASVCPPNGAACRVMAATTQVYLDHATGAFIFAETSGQRGPPPSL